MKKIKKAMLLGDYTNFRYHPLKGVDTEISDILRADFEVDCTEDYGMLENEVLKKYDLLIFYPDFRNGKIMSKEQTEAVMSWLESGGGMLVIHNGISIQTNEGFLQLFGGTFTGHPPYERLPVLEYYIKAADHPICQGVENFILGDEPYMFDLYPSDEKIFLFEYKYEDKLWPAAWAKEYGEGKVVYLAPGHNAHGFKNPTFRRIIINSSHWVSR